MQRVSPRAQWVWQLFALLLLPLVLACHHQPNRESRTGVQKTSAGSESLDGLGMNGEGEPVAQAAIRQGNGERRISGPYVQQNLALYLIHSSDRDDREFILLDEGLKKGVVKVSEKAQAEVNELMIENRDQHPLFLQEGDRLQGGKQDRIVYSSLVVGPQSGEVPIPSFCIEQSRWQRGSSGSQFRATETTALSPKSVRMAAKMSKSQGKVWNKVSREKKKYADGLGVASRTSSLNEALDSKKVAKASKAMTDHFRELAAKHSDSVGVAFAIGGKLEEVDVYPGHTLFAKVYPRLLQSYAMDASVQNKPKDEVDPPTAEQVAELLKASGGKPVRDEKIGTDNNLEVYEHEDRFRAKTRYKRGVVHEQLLLK